MKKLLKLLSVALITAAMFTSCESPAGTTVPDQDDDKTVEQFRSKLLAFECGITASGNAVIIYEQGDSNYSEYIYIKKNGSWIQAGDLSLEHLKKEKNEFYITGDGEKIYTYTFTGNNLNLISTLPNFIEVFGSNTATFIKTATNNLPADLKTLLENSNITVEQFINKLMTFDYGINRTETAVIIHKEENQEKSEYLYIKQEGTWVDAGKADLSHLKKENNEFYMSGDGQKIYTYTFTGNNLNLISSLPQFIEVFGSNTATFIKTTQDNLPAELISLINK